MARNSKNLRLFVGKLDTFEVFFEDDGEEAPAIMLKTLFVLSYNRRVKVIDKIATECNSIDYRVAILTVAFLYPVAQKLYKGVRVFVLQSTGMRFVGAYNISLKGPLDIGFRRRTFPDESRFCYRPCGVRRIMSSKVVSQGNEVRDKMYRKDTTGKTAKEKQQVQSPGTPAKKRRRQRRTTSGSTNWSHRHAIRREVWEEGFGTNSSVRVGCQDSWLLG